MPTPNTSRRPQVNVQFGDGHHAFVLHDGATLTDLAQSIHGLEAQHGAAPISIQIAFGSAKSRTKLPEPRDQHAH
jgi:hypothetical protein